MTFPLDSKASAAILAIEMLLLILLGSLLAAVAILSLHWTFGYDTAQMLYFGRLIDQLHYVPYRDIFEENMPGAFLAYALIGKLIDYSNSFLLRLLDLGYLIAISLATWRWLKRLSKRVAAGAVILFCLVYLLGGPGFSTQREYLFLVPVIGAAWIAGSGAQFGDTARALFIGLLFGLATTIKPHAGIGLLPVSAYLYFEIRARDAQMVRSWRRLAGLLAVCGAGALLPLAAMVIGLAAVGGLAAWTDILTRYWPLYATTTGSLTVLTGVERLRYIGTALATFGGEGAWLIPAAVGTVVAQRSGILAARQRRIVWLMLGLALSYFLYPAFTGQFYPQHWLPFSYFILALSGLCFVDLRRAAHWPIQIVPAAAITMALILRSDMLLGGASQLLDYYLYHRPIPSIDGDRSNEIASYLESHLKPGETVQPLDGVGYAMQGMLIARATPATRFPADAPFYTQPDAPYIQGLRSEFIQAMKDSQPRYVVDVMARVRLVTNGALPPFPELDELLQTSYSPAYIGHGFVIYQRAEAFPTGVIAYPTEFTGMNPPDIVPLKDHLLTFKQGKPAANPAAMQNRLEGFSTAHRRILYENLGEDSDSERLIELWLNQHVYRLGETRIADTQLVEYINPAQSCPDGAPTDWLFGGIIRVQSAGATLLTIDNGNYLCLRLTMSAVQTAARSYLVSVHVLDPSTRLVAQYDSMPQGNLYPTTLWQPNQPVTDQFAIHLPDALSAGSYEVVLYISDVETHEVLTTSEAADSTAIGTLVLP